MYTIVSSILYTYFLYGADYISLKKRDESWLQKQAPVEFSKLVFLIKGPLPVVQKIRRLCSEDKEISWTHLKDVGVSPGLSGKISSVIRRYSFVHDYLVHLICFELLSGWVECCLKLHNQNTFMCPCFNDSRVYIRKL